MLNSLNIVRIQKSNETSYYSANVKVLIKVLVEYRLLINRE